MHVPRPRLASRILSVAVAVTLIAFYSDTMRRRLLVRRAQVTKPLSGRSTLARSAPPPLDTPIEILGPYLPQGKIWGVCPALGDLDGDGRDDLLVGDGMGRMKFHRNVGTAARAEFAPPAWFDEICPDGRIPVG